MTHSRPRRRIEIYFVLYLVALVLLLPDRVREGAGSAGVAVINSDISLELRPERLKLECQLERAPDGTMQLVSIDSTNTIHYSGDLADVTLRARVEDDRTGQVIMVEPGSEGNTLFQLIPHPEQRTAVFVWRPLRADRSAHKFRVTILGSGAPTVLGGPKGANRQALPSGLRVSGSTQFVVETQVRSQSTALGPQGGRDTIFQIQRPTSELQPVGPFWVGAASSSIRIAPGATWTNRLSFGGAEPMRNLKGLPRVSASRSGVTIERFLDSTQQAVILKGRAPGSGSYTVTVRAERDDGEIRETSFEVESVLLDRPDIPRVVYSGLTYRIDPRLPDVVGAKAVLRLGNRVIASSTEGILRFTLDEADEGKQLSLERTLDGEAMESPFTITVMAYPAPEIRDVKPSGNGDSKRVVVLFYGDRKNNRPTLEVVNGNAAAPQKQYGNLRPADPNDTEGMRWLEDFEVRRADGGKPFVFTLRAKDGRGRYSTVWSED